MNLPHRVKCLTTIFAIMLISLSAKAHEFWIEAEPYNQKRAGEVLLSLRVGTGFVGDTVPNVPQWYRDFSVTHNGKTEPVSGNIGDDPAGHIHLKQSGLYIIGYENYPDFIKLNAKKFNQYLKNEGLDDVLKARSRSGKQHHSAKEYYQRCVKALLRVGTRKITLEALQQQKGYKLEITPLNVPYDSDHLTVSIYFDGKPLVNTQITAFTKTHPENKQIVRSDNKGQVTFDIKESGNWMISSVHMIPYLGRNADWISYWGNLSFVK